MSSAVTASSARVTDFAQVDGGGAVNSDFENQGRFRGLYLGTSGDVTISLDGNDYATMKNLAAGMWHGVPDFDKIVASTTTAQDVLAGR